MEEEKAAAYYDELNRKGEGARRFKQGLGFSSSEPSAASFPSKPPTTTTSSFLSGFVRAGATPAPAAQHPNPTKQTPPPAPTSRAPRRSRSPSPSRARSPSRSRRRRSRSRSREPPRRRSRSRSRERGDRRSSRRRTRSRSRSRSPSRRSSRSSYSGDRRDRHGDRRRDDGGGRRESSKGRGEGKGGGKVDYSRLIEGYDRMTPAERVKAKMKLQLSETASKDATLGTGTVGWERFEFNKDAPLDEDDNDVEVANDDASLVKHIGKSFRLSAVESNHEDIVRDAHDEAMFGVPKYSIIDTETTVGELKTNEGEEPEDVEAEPASSLVSDKVLAMQKGSWRERAQKLRQHSNT